jgi:hypothetical protein
MVSSEQYALEIGGLSHLYFFLYQRGLKYPWQGDFLKVMHTCAGVYM